MPHTVRIPDAASQMRFNFAVLLQSFLVQALQVELVSLKEDVCVKGQAKKHLGTPANGAMGQTSMVEMLVQCGNEDT